MGQPCEFQVYDKTVQGWPKLWADFKARIWTFSQSVKPSLTIWANPAQFSFYDAIGGLPPGLPPTKD
jgi:hypothetical protein